MTMGDGRPQRRGSEMTELEDYKAKLRSMTDEQLNQEWDCTDPIQQDSPDDPFDRLVQEMGLDQELNDQRLGLFNKVQAIRKEVGLRINPETAEVAWNYVEILDPYDDGIILDPETRGCIGRGYFARSPGSKIWVEFGDLPEATAKALWGDHKKDLAFPAGLEATTSEN
jgi:hypothetical protein